MMVLGTQLPSWKQVFTKNKQRKEKSYYENDNSLLLSESCMSINLIINAVKNIHKLKNVTICLPDYFCNQTIYSFREDWMEIIYYPITEDMNPEWNEIRRSIANENIDVFLGVHYFGQYHADINTAREFCELHDILLIEDCAHVLYPTGKMGQTGDFVIYSPHKQIPVRDVAILQYNVSEKNKGLFEEVKRLYNLLDTEKNDYKWYIKRCIQKIVPLHRKLTYYYATHVGENIKKFHAPKKISKESYNTLCDYDYDALKRIAYIRRDNISAMNYIMQKRYPEIIPLMSEKDEVPYLAVFSMKNLANQEKITRDILKSGFTMLYWPDLPYEMGDTKEHAIAKELSKNIITFPIHQGVKPQLLIKKFAPKIKKANRNIELVWNGFSQEEWESLYDKYNITNIPQEWVYGTAKERTESWKVRRALICIGTENIGTLQLLEKTVMGFTVAVRVNRGPLYIPDYNNPENHFIVMDLIRKKYMPFIPIVYAPYIKMTAENLHMINNYGWKCIDFFGFSSSIVNLTLTESELKKNLKSNWRKNLKKAEKQVSIKYNEYDVQDILKLYNEFLKMKKISGIPTHILKYLFSLKNPPLEVLTAHNDIGKMIAYKVLYKHGNTATSFIAWNTDEGLEKNARTLLIYSSMLRLKELGFENFDLGGVDDINTEAVAKYKRGMGGVDYRLLGEFLKF